MNIKKNDLTKTERNIEDNKQILGKACKDTSGRMMATLYGVTASTEFIKCTNIDNGGLLLALPALLANGLLDSIEKFIYRSGFYRLQDIMLTIAFMCLARIKNINQLADIQPGEWGALLGIDRIPEKKTLRDKLDLLSHAENEKILSEWIIERSSKWMEESAESVGHFFIDGHVRTYYGKQKLPRRYVSRQRICIRGMTDYWVNDQKGLPFFVVTTPFSKGLMSVMNNTIIPKLLQEAPDLKSTEELRANPRKPYKFLIVFDKEGYSMKWSKELWESERIATSTYHKYPEDDWDEEEFNEVTIELPFGVIKKIKLAEKIQYNKKYDFEYREIRELTETGHQVSVMGTNFYDNILDVYSFMDSRTSQENFFRYARQDYNIDTLNSNEKINPDETEKIVNPRWREVEKELRSLRSKLSRRSLKDRELALPDNPTEKEQRIYEEKRSVLRKEIEDLELSIAEKKELRSTLDHYITFRDLSEDEKFLQFHGGRKKIIDIIKMISYRAETAMANIIIPSLTQYDQDAAKAIIKSIFQTQANLIPDYENQILTVELLYSSTHKKDKIIQVLMDVLNETEFNFPMTNLRLFYKFVSQ